MKNVLLVTSSPRGEASYSAQVATELAREITGEIGGSLTVRELWREPIPAIGPEFVHAGFAPEADRTPEQRATLATSDELIAELQAADVVVVAAGMINFGMPATLKTWIDHLSRKGVTFRYGEAGPEGMVTGKRLVLVLASGGVYTSGPMLAMNHLEPPLRTNLGFMGLTNVETVWIEGVAYGEDAAELALASARERSREVAAGFREVVAGGR